MSSVSEELLKAAFSSPRRPNSTVSNDEIIDDLVKDKTVVKSKHDIKPLNLILVKNYAGGSCLQSPDKYQRSINTTSPSATPESSKSHDLSDDLDFPDSLCGSARVKRSKDNWKFKNKSREDDYTPRSKVEIITMNIIINND